MDEIKSINLLYQDEHLVVCDKPVNLPVHKNDFMPHDAPYLTKFLGKTLEKSIYNVHRLDSKTSGVIVLALLPEIAKNLSLQFERKEVSKKYLALVKGNPGKEGTFSENVLIKKKGKKKQAISHYRTIQTIQTDISYKDIENVEISLVEIETETGRWHQIRQHFAMHRFDILGDTHHGDWTLNKIITEKTGVKRLFLHASKLDFYHPLNEKVLSFEAELPKEFDDIIQYFS